MVVIPIPLAAEKRCSPLAVPDDDEERKRRLSNPSPSRNDVERSSSAVQFQHRGSRLGKGAPSARGRVQRSGRSPSSLVRDSFQTTPTLCRIALDVKGILISSFILDSPLLAYRAPEGTEDDLTGTDLNEQFYSYLAELSADRQVIIVENYDPPAAIISGSQTTMFSRNPHSGRYGFFPLRGSEAPSERGSPVGFAD
jgi:hypothetical protein